MATKVKRTTSLQERITKRFAHIPSQAARRMFEIELDKILPNPDQPRQTFNNEYIRELAGSIDRHGQLQPIILKEIGDGEHYMLAAGECRLRAHRLLGKTHIYAVMTDGNANEISLIENIQRQNLTPLEEAAAMQRMITHYHYTHEELARIVGKARSTITNILKLNSLPQRIKEECSTSNTISKSLLMEIVRLPSPKKQLAFWEQVKQRDTTVSAARQARKRNRVAVHPLSPAVQAVSAARSFARQLADVAHQEWRDNQEQYAQLLEIYRDISDRISALQADCRIP